MRPAQVRSDKDNPVGTACSLMIYLTLAYSMTSNFENSFFKQRFILSQRGVESALVQAEGMMLSTKSCSIQCYVCTLSQVCLHLM